MTGTDSTSFTQPRQAIKTLVGKFQHAGAAVDVKRYVGSEMRCLDPFLLFDDAVVCPPAGFPDHGHRGFDTLTYILQGGLVHQDFLGNKGTIRAGDIQLMTAGRGIIHSANPASEGVQKCLQLWINLASQVKMMEPEYEEFTSEEFPIAEKNGAEVKVIVGESMGVKSPVTTITPIMYLDVRVKPGSEVHQQIPESWNAFAYIVDGEAIIGNQKDAPFSEKDLVVLSGGDGVSVWNKSLKPLRFMLVAGQPLNEPLAHDGGPYVMNTQAEIDQAIEDYREKKNGFELGKNWKSELIVRD